MSQLSQLSQGLFRMAENRGFQQVSQRVTPENVTIPVTEAAESPFWAGSGGNFGILGFSLPSAAVAGSGRGEGGARLRAYPLPPPFVNGSPVRGTRERGFYWTFAGGEGA